MKDDLLSLMIPYKTEPYPRTCMHYGCDGPAFWPIMYVTKKGQVIRCPVCGRKMVDRKWRRAIRRWNKQIKRLREKEQ